MAHLNYNYEILQEIYDLGETVHYAQCLAAEHNPGISDIGPSLYTRVYEKDEEVHDVIIDNSLKTHHPGFYWAWKGLGLEIQAIIPDMRHDSFLSTFISVYLFDSETPAGACVEEAVDASDSGNALRDCCYSTGIFNGEDNRIWNWYENGNDITPSYFYIGSEDEASEGSLYLHWNSGYTSFPGHLGIFDFPFDTSYSWFKGTGGTEPNIDEAEWKSGSNNKIMPSYDMLSEDDMQDWTNQILGEDSKFIVVISTGGDRSDGWGRDERDRNYYKFDINKSKFKRLIDDNTVDKLIIEYAEDDEHWYEHENDDYGGYWKSDDVYPRSMGIDITTPGSGTKVETINRYPMVAEHRDDRGDADSGGTNYREPVFYLSGARFILSGPGGIDRNMIHEVPGWGPNTLANYDPFPLEEQTGTLQQRNWSKDFDREELPWEDEPSNFLFHEYANLNPENYVDYISFGVDLAPRVYPDQPAKWTIFDDFRPISDLKPIIEGVDEDDVYPPQSYYDFGEFAYEQLSTPLEIELSFDLSEYHNSIDYIHDYGSYNRINDEGMLDTATTSDHPPVGFKFAVYSWENSDNEDENIFNNAMSDFRDPNKFLKWQEVFGANHSTSNVNLGKLKYRYFFGGVKTIHAFVFAYMKGHRNDPDEHYIQPMRWKYVKIKLNITPGMSFLEDFGQIGGSDFTTLPWKMSSTPIISGISSESNYFKSIEAAINGGDFGTSETDQTDYNKLLNAYRNDELGDFVGKVDIAQTRVFNAPYDMRELLMLPGPWTTEVFSDIIGSDIGLTTYPPYCVETSKFAHTQYGWHDSYLETTANNYCIARGFDDALEYTESLELSGNNWRWSTVYGWVCTDSTVSWTTIETITCRSYIASLEDAWYPYTDIYDPDSNDEGYWGNWNSDSPNYFNKNSCIGTLYISENANRDLRDNCIIELNMANVESGAILDTSGNAIAGILLGDYGISKPGSGLPMIRDSAINKPTTENLNKAF